MNTPGRATLGKVAALQRAVMAHASPGRSERRTTQRLGRRFDQAVLLCKNTTTRCLRPRKWMLSGRSTRGKDTRTATALYGWQPGAERTRGGAWITPRIPRSRLTKFATPTMTAVLKISSGFSHDFATMFVLLQRRGWFFFFFHATIRIFDVSRDGGSSAVPGWASGDLRGEFSGVLRQRADFLAKFPDARSTPERPVSDFIGCSWCRMGHAAGARSHSSNAFSHWNLG